MRAARLPGTQECCARAERRPVTRGRHEAISVAMFSIGILVPKSWLDQRKRRASTRSADNLAPDHASAPGEASGSRNLHRIVGLGLSVVTNRIRHLRRSALAATDDGSCKGLAEVRCLAFTIPRNVSSISRGKMPSQPRRDLARIAQRPACQSSGGRDADEFGRPAGYVPPAIYIPGFFRSIRTLRF
jgi:hypothetical protein